MIKLVNDTINKEDIKSLCEWLLQDEIPRLTKGDLTLKLESKWSEKIGTKYSVYVNSGSSAILLALAALLQSDKLKNNKIIIPSLSSLLNPNLILTASLQTLFVTKFVPRLGDSWLNNIPLDINIPYEFL